MMSWVEVCTAVDSSDRGLLLKGQIQLGSAAVVISAPRPLREWKLDSSWLCCVPANSPLALSIQI